MLGNSNSYTGNLAREVIPNFTGTGQTVATATVYVPIPKKDGAGKQMKEPIDITFWGKDAENLANFSTKGTLVSVACNIQRDIKEINGKKHYGLKLTAESFIVHDSKAKVEADRQRHKNQKEGEQ